MNFNASPARRTLFAAAVVFAATLPLASARAEDNTFTLTIKDHVFTPATIEVPAGQRIKLVVVNEDSTTEEFESKILHIEKLVGGNKTITVLVGPLDPGTYEFVGEFHEDSAKGTLVAK